VRCLYEPLTKAQSDQEIEYLLAVKLLRKHGFDAEYQPTICITPNDEVGYIRVKTQPEPTPAPPGAKEGER
jgi:hypothetical protein